MYSPHSPSHGKDVELSPSPLMPTSGKTFPPRTHPVGALSPANLKELGWVQPWVDNPQTPHGRWEGICMCLHRSLFLWGEQRNRKRQFGFSVVMAPTFSAAGRASEYQPQTDSLVGEVLANALPAQQKGACALLGEGGRFYVNRLGKSHKNYK